MARKYHKKHGGRGGHFWKKHNNYSDESDSSDNGNNSKAHWHSHQNMPLGKKLVGILRLPGHNNSNKNKKSVRFLEDVYHDGNGTWDRKHQSDSAWGTPMGPWINKIPADSILPWAWPSSNGRTYGNPFADQRNQFGANSNNDNKRLNNGLHNNNLDNDYSHSNMFINGGGYLVKTPNGEQEDAGHLRLPPVSDQILAAVAYSATIRYLDPNRQFTDTEAAKAGYPPPWYGIHAAARNNRWDEDEHTGPEALRTTTRIVRDLLDELYWKRDMREKLMRESQRPEAWWEDYNTWYRVETECRLNEKPRYVNKDQRFESIHLMAKAETQRYNEWAKWSRDEQGGLSKMDTTEDPWDAATIYPAYETMEVD
jgi:hypothetical protein